jgi:hypothetical protein
MNGKISVLSPVDGGPRYRLRGVSLWLHLHLQGFNTGVLQATVEVLLARTRLCYERVHEPGQRLKGVSGDWAGRPGPCGVQQLRFTICQSYVVTVPSIRTKSLWIRP